MKRLLLFVPIMLLCLAAAPVVLPLSGSTSPKLDPVGEGKIPTQVEFEALLKSNPIAAFDASLARFKRDVRGYQCILQKQETLGGKLGDVEVIRHAVREEPFSVFLYWEQGSGSAKAALYVRGENGGRMRVKTKYLIETNSDTNGLLARNSARYSIEDAGIFNATLRTFRAWGAAPRELIEYQGRKLVPELNRECYVLKRTCVPLDVDNFRMSDTEVRDPAKYPNEAFANVTVYLDCETWLQIGSVLRKADGSLFAAYWFKDVQLNPQFAADQFTPAAIRK